MDSLLELSKYLVCSIARYSSEAGAIAGTATSAMKGSGCKILFQYLWGAILVPCFDVVTPFQLTENEPAWMHATVAIAAIRPATLEQTMALALCAVLADHSAGPH